MANTKAKGRAPKVDARLAQIREAVGKGTEIEQLWAIDQAFGAGEREQLAKQLVDGEHGTGAVAAWLRVLAGVGAPTDDKVLVECFLQATSGRVLLLRILATIEARLDDATFARAIAQLEVAAPFAPVVLARGRVAVRAAGDITLADHMDARADFVTRHATLLAKLAKDAKEKEQQAGTAALAKLSGDDRDLAAHWVLTVDGTPRDANRWAREVAIVSPAIPVLIAADSLNESFIHDDEEKRLGEIVTAGGPPALARATQILDEAVGRGWSQVLEHLMPAVPAVCAAPAGFDAVMRGLAREDQVADRLCEDARYWAKALTPAQAAQVAERLIALCELAQDSRHTLHHSSHRAMFYFENPAGLATFAAALARTDLSIHTRDQLYDAIENIETRDAQDVLIDQLFVETRNVRDLVYAFNKACMPHRHADVLARLDAKPSLDAAWIYIGCQMHWAHRPRHVLDVIERVLAWPPGGDKGKRASVFSQAVVCALELRRYELARRCLDLMTDAKKCADPTEKEPADTVLANKDLAKQLAALRSGKLEAEQAAQADKVAKLRAAGTPRAADDELLGMLAGGTMGLRVHTHAKTHEVWFFDQEGAFFYYDGYGIVPPPFVLTIMRLVNGWDVELPGLVAFCTGWHTTARSLHTGEGTREILLSGDRLLVHYQASSNPLLTWGVLGFTFPDAAAAQSAFDGLHAHPNTGSRAVDPYYVPGARGGTWVREYGNDTAFGYVVGSAVATGTGSKWSAQQKPAGSVDKAIAKFVEEEDGWLQRGLYPRKLELEKRILPLDDMPLAKWLDDRERDDEKDAPWHLDALPAIISAIEVTELPLEAIEVELGPPATVAELAAYDAALPEPMPDVLRAMWVHASTARWQVGKRIQRVLSPAEVLAGRDARRADLAKRIAATRGGAKLGWEPDHLDVFVVNGDDSWVAFDVRQQDNDCYYDVATNNLRYHSSSALNWMLAEKFASDLVDELVERFPEIKKLKYGQSIVDLIAKTKPTKAKAKAKAAAKKAGAKKSTAAQRRRR